MDQEYVVYQATLIPSKVKGEYPDVVFIYLSDTLHNPCYSSEIEYAYRFFDLTEAKHVADVLDMDVGLLEIKVKRVG